MLLAFGAALAMAKPVKIETLRLAGPYNVMKPVVVDSVSAEQKKFNDDYVISTSLSLDAVKSGIMSGLDKANLTKGALYLAGFTFQTTTYQKVIVEVKGAKASKVFIKGKENSGNYGAQPGQYDVVVKFVADTADVNISLNCDSVKTVIMPCQAIDNTGKSVTMSGKTVATSGGNAQDMAVKRPFSLADNMHMKHYGGLSVSPSGKYAIVATSGFDTNGQTQSRRYIIDALTGKKLRTVEGGAQWMPKQDRLLRIRKQEGKSQLVSIDPFTLDEAVVCSDMPVESYVMSPTEDFLILYNRQEGPKKEDGVYQILNMDDRQPGWRGRSTFSKLDLKSGLVQPLTYGHRSMWVNDISEDGKYIYFSVNDDRLEKRPTTLTSLLRMKLEDLSVDTLINREGFMNSPTLIPGTQKLLVVGSAEAFDGIGRNLPDNMTPNIYEHQLFLFDGETKTVTPLTRNFTPSIESVTVNGKDGYAYFTAQNADSVSLYRLDLKTYAIKQVNQPCEVISSIDIASHAGTILYYGSGACTSDKLYTLNLKNLKSQVIDDVNADRMADIALGTCEAWRFNSERGYELTGHAYLPANFDKSKKYPMIVHYYGGCSPTSRRFGGGSHYPAHYWNALGYIVLVVNPSGASGFGQEWGARHVNTAGEGPAQDIIEATKWYCKHNTAVNDKKLGCVSASYGGFMTQWILTKTDMFACGISHAGISDHTSYWGEGYWGYNYSEVSMANSYPWTRKDLYVDCSPLYNADKIHTPLLFTHGTADTNVPIGESIQMFTALKLLGCPTAFVMVEGENHGIMDYTKRQKWINTMMAWFQKYLQDDSSWWDAIYTPKEL